MKKLSVYDLPIRIFHWLFALLFLAAFFIPQFVGDDSSLFTYHMLAGLTIAFLLVLRLIWGFFGTTYSRFSSFKMSPLELGRYFKDLVFKKTKEYLGHNPASSYAAVVMFICAIGLAYSGIAMTSGAESEFNEELHEVLAMLFLISVIAHLVGIAIHHLKHRDALWSSMFDGKKKNAEETGGITNTRPVAGLVFLVLALAFMGYLNNQYNRSTRSLDLFGTELRLGEEEHESHDGEHEEGEEYEQDEH